MAKELPEKQNRLPPMINVMLIASAKSGCAREPSQQPDSMSVCLTISHPCLPCLPSERKFLFWRDLFVVGVQVSWERWESIKMGRYERCVSGMKWQAGKSI